MARRYLLPRDEERAAALLGSVPRWQAGGSRAIGQVAKVLNPGEGLLNWANRVGLEGKTLEEARSPKRSGGSKAHTAFTAFADVLPEGSGGIVKWAAETAPVILATERWMASLDAPAVHGKADYVRAGPVVAGITPLIVGDAKPLGNGRTYFESHVQVAGYAYCLEQAGLVVAGTEILLYDDRDYHVVPGVVSTVLFASLARLAATIERLKAEI
jgi:hypothetical protein